MSYFIPRPISNFAYRVLSPSMAVPLDWVTKAFQPQGAWDKGSEDILVARLLGGAANFFAAPREKGNGQDIIMPRVMKQGGRKASGNVPRISVVDRTVDGVMHKAYVISDRLGLPDESETPSPARRRNVRVAIIGTVAEGMFTTRFLQVGIHVLPLTEGNISDALLYAEKLTAQILNGTYDPAAARQNMLRAPQGLFRAWGEGARDRILARMARMTDKPAPHAK